MNRKVFMERLRECLADISAEEREDALTYYESYFEEAGVENEAQVIEELGSPEKVAENIKRDLLEEPQSSIQAPECMEKESSEDFSSEDFEKHEQYEEYEQKDKSGRIAMVIVIAVLTFPIWITVAATLFGLIVAAFGVLFGCAAGGIAATVYGSVAGQFRHVAVGSSIFVENHGKEERSVCHEKICERLSDLSSRMFGTWRCGMRNRTGIRSRNRRAAAGIS